MRRRKWLVYGILGFAVVILPIVIASAIFRAKDRAAYQEQLRLARSEGLPITAAEFAATIPKADEHENAAPFYRALKGKIKHEPDPVALAAELTFIPSKATRDKAIAHLDKTQVALKIIDQAVALPRCWLDRKWELGWAVMFPELSDMKGSAKLLVLRGSVAAADGKPRDAINDVEHVFRIAKHAGEEGHSISALVKTAIYQIGLRALANWAFCNHSQAEYQVALRNALQGVPVPNLKFERRGILYETLNIIELCSTAAGRAEVGLKPDDVSSAELYMPFLRSKLKARIEIVKSLRRFWASCDLPTKQRDAAIRKADEDYVEALRAFPTVSDLLGMLGSGLEFMEGREKNWKTWVQQYSALLMALSEKKIPASIATNTFPSPFDGNPLSYRYDGKQITISVSGYKNDSGPILLQLPPEKLVRR